MTLANRYSHINDTRALIEEGIEEYWSDVEERYDAESLHELFEEERAADEIRKKLAALDGERKKVFAVIADTDVRYGVNVAVVGIYESDRVAKRACDLLNELERFDGWEETTKYRVQPMTLNCHEAQLGVWYME